MNFNFSKIASAIAASMLISAAGGAHAAIVVDDWTMNLNGVDGLVAAPVTGIDQIQFSGVARATQTVNDGVVSVGDIGRTQGLLEGTSILHNGASILTSGVNSTYQLNFVFDVATLTFNTPDAINSNFTHLAYNDALSIGAGSTGLLKIYVDNINTLQGDLAFTQSDQSTGLGYSDGELIATFRILAGLGGGFNAATFNGTDDAIFELVSAKAGVFTDNSGNDLLPGATLLSTASQFDADTNNDGSPDILLAAGSPIGSCTAAGFSPTAFCAQEDGRASLQLVPEPSSVALMGLALAGLGFSRRQVRK